MTDKDMVAQVPEWRYTEKPPKLERRFEFDSYTDTRAFLDRLAEVSKEEKYYPDLSFGRTHVHVTIQARNEQAIAADDVAFARRVNDLRQAP